MSITDRWPRREFLKTALGCAGVASSQAYGEGSSKDDGPKDPTHSAQKREQARSYNQPYEGIAAERVAFPLGGLGAGMICMEGNGSLSKFSLRHKPDLREDGDVFAAVSVHDPNYSGAKIIEGPLPNWKFSSTEIDSSAILGLPRFAETQFEGRFPFGHAYLTDSKFPLVAKVTGWSPFTPGDADNSSLPVAGVEYELKNISKNEVNATFSFNVSNFMGGKSDSIRRIANGLVLCGSDLSGNLEDADGFAVWIDEPEVQINNRWFSENLSDSLRVAWLDARAGKPRPTEPTPDKVASSGASIFVPLKLKGGSSKTIVVKIAWYVQQSKLRISGGARSFQLLMDGDKPGVETYKAWYVGRFEGIDEVVAYWKENYSSLREASERFSGCFFSTTLPAEAIEAVSANLSILKSTTILRQADGRLWGWEGSNVDDGSCAGSCTHVWNYAQSIPHLFPALERTLRETEFGPSQSLEGHQVFRTALPIRAVDQNHSGLPAADGQLGGVMKAYREWRISGSTEWLKTLWPKIRTSLDFCIRTWDPRHKGWLEEPQHNTTDTEFWGPNGMCTSIYLGALNAAILMGRELNEDVTSYSILLEKGRAQIAKLFNGEYYEQQICWQGLSANYLEESRKKDSHVISADASVDSPQTLIVVESEGPKYQYGQGCLANGLFGEWLAIVCGLKEVTESESIKRHLLSVYRYNFKRSLRNHECLGRSTFANGEEGGLVMCTWPENRENLTFPFMDADEVWTGVEYEVASHLISHGFVEQGLEIVRTCRDRYNSGQRNPFSEVESGEWYARAMASYSLLQALSGAFFDAVDSVLYLRPVIKGDYTSFISTESGYGLVGVKQGKPFIEVVFGTIPVRKIEYVTSA
jgi:uncharacterized protein (DUF608 family)